MKEINAPLTYLPYYEDIMRDISEGIFPIEISGLIGAQKAYVVSTLNKMLDRPTVIVVQNEIDAKQFCEDLSFFIPEKVMHFPARDVVLHDVEAMSKEIISKRMAVLTAVFLQECPIVVTTIEALMQKMTEPQRLRKCFFNIKVSDEISIKDLTIRLLEAGYERTDIVDSKGQFCIRGGIFDFFPVNCNYAYRIEFFGDSVDSIRKFEPATQRSTEMLEELQITPSTETIIFSDEIPNIINLIKNEYSQMKNNDDETKGRLWDRINWDVERLTETGVMENSDRYYKHINQSNSTFLEYFSEEPQIFIDEPARAFIKAEAYYKEFWEIYISLLEKGSVLPSSKEIIFNQEEIFYLLEKKALISISAFPSNNKTKFKNSYDIKSKEISGIANHEILFGEVKSYKEAGYRIVLLAGNKISAQRISHEYRQRELENVFVEVIDVQKMGKGVSITSGSISGSFEFPEIKLAVLSEKKLFREEKRKKRESNKKPIIDFVDIKPGDYVVHNTHGIGKYVGIDKLQVEGVIRDYLKIEYLNSDMLYIPTTQLETIQKYIGAEGKPPKLNRFGGSEWQKTKRRVQDSLRYIAEELIQLYAQRQANKGFPFSKDTVWQKEFEEQFPYQETDDQLTSIEDVKKDMESEKAMDRLLCGDVGVGKTEVAIRGAFKAAMEGKQVAYLVPTTILAQQHYNNFVQRMRDFPVKVEMISRFRTQSQQKKILKDTKNGMIDILIGTHRLIQKDIQFNNLGLLIIDEEQRFGVSHKEKIKAMKNNVDVLTLTATPIPRTLHMALVGIRDMSAIYEPPEDRHPIQTFVIEYDQEIIREAIIRELNRNGQIFYLSNRVKSINKVAAEVKAMVPNASVITAHGQMDEKELEDIMMGFVEGKWNVLVCTTIIESGLDIPNVNTIIIEDADRLGLAQLYQLRGRVGRASRLAHAYLTYRKDKVISEDAEKRLKAIKDFTEFGSGFKIAMRDLEIRGAGNLIGAEQHGHIEAVGYDTYCRLLESAVKELKGEEVKEEINVQIDLNISAYISDEYINNEIQKIEMYKRIASVNDENDIDDIKDELIDRYGDIPQDTVNLLEIANIKVLAKELGIVSVGEKQGAILWQLTQDKIDFETISKFVSLYKGKILFSASNPPYITCRGISRNNGALENIKNLLQDLKKLQAKQ